MKDFRELIINESIDGTLKKIETIASQIKGLEYYQHIIRNVKKYMEQPAGVSINKLERAYDAIKSEITEFVKQIKTIKKVVSSIIIDDVENTVLNLEKTLTYSYTQKTMQR